MEAKISVCKICDDIHLNRHQTIRKHIQECFKLQEKPKEGRGENLKAQQNLFSIHQNFQGLNKDLINIPQK